MLALNRRTFLASGAALAAGSWNEANCAPAPGKWRPRIAENISGLEENTLRWMAQLGIEWVDLQGSEAVDRDKKGWWSPEDVRAAVDRCAQFGLRIAAITVPFAWQMNSMLGKPERDRDIENIARSIAGVGAARIPVFQYRWSPDFYWGEEMGYRTVEGRGGVRYSSFDFDLVKDKPPFPEIGTISYDQLWERLMYFLRVLVPAAEKAGVKLSLHPKDPPQPVVRGVARLLTSTEQIEKFVDAIPNPAHGFTFCQGTVTEMGVDVIDAIRRIGRRGKIHHVHFRGVRGKVPRYTEVFIDEGDVDMLAAMRAYREVGFEGALVSDHTPRIAGDNAAGLMGRSFSHGYIRALVQAVNAGS